LADNRLDDSSFYLEKAVENRGPYSEKAANLIDEVEKRAEDTAM